MSEYTPTTEEIREYVETGGEPRPWVELDETEQARERARVAAFDRWLAAHDAEVLARAASVGSDEPYQQIAEEPEWEYGVESRFEESDEAYDAVEWGSREQAEAVARDQNEEEAHEDGYVRLVYSVVKRVPAVPAGPWVPVKQEGADE